MIKIGKKKLIEIFSKLLRQDFKEVSEEYEYLEKFPSRIVMESENFILLIDGSAFGMSGRKLSVIEKFPNLHCIIKVNFDNERDWINYIYDDEFNVYYIILESLEKTIKEEFFDYLLNKEERKRNGVPIPRVIELI